MAPPSTRRRRGVAAAVQIQHKRFDIPYFAHQQLDPETFIACIRIPVGKPGWAPAPKEIATATNGGWEDDVDAPFEEDPDDDSLIEANSQLHLPGITPLKRKAPGSVNKDSYKRLKVAGGRPAIAKKVTADLDSDDELIVRMKNAKYLEKDIAQRLADEGRIAYNPKTIGTRWARLRRALEKRNDELLDADLTDWHEGDDDVLRQAIEKADEIVEKQKAEIDARKWRVVADQMKNLKPVVNFSQNACRGRYQALQQGTAKPTPESVQYPDEATLKSIQSRKEKEKKIQRDMTLTLASSINQGNIDGNAWTSKKRNEWF